MSSAGWCFLFGGTSDGCVKIMVSHSALMLCIALCNLKIFSVGRCTRIFAKLLTG